jgi:hypothetical protein
LSYQLRENVTPSILSLPRWKLAGENSQNLSRGPPSHALSKLGYNQEEVLH